MQMGQNVGVKLLASVLVGGDQDLGDGFVNLCFIIQAKLGCVVTVLQDWMAPAFPGFLLQVPWRGPLAQLQALPFRSWHVWDRSVLFLSVAER